MGATVMGIGLVFVAADATATHIAGLSGVAEARLGWTLIAVGVLGIVWASAVSVRERIWPGPDRALVRQAHSLGERINAFMADRKRDASQEDRQGPFEQRVAAYTRHSTETMASYQTRYHLDALRLYKQLVERGLVDSQVETSFTHPTNPLGVEEVARILAAVGGKV